MRRLLIPIGLAAVLGGCTQHETPSGGPVPPADAPTEAAPWNQDVNGVGTEPFWGVEIRKDRLKLFGPDRADVVVNHGGPTAHGDTMVFEGTSPSGALLKITLTPAHCSDGMSDRAYPFRLFVETSGETLDGCAAPASAP